MSHTLVFLQFCNWRHPLVHSSHSACNILKVHYTSSSYILLPSIGPISSSSIIDSDNRRPVSGKKARAAKQGNVVTPNPLRPHVPAADRLQGWQTPFSREFDASLISQFGLDFFTHFHKVLLASLDEPTRVNYGAGLLRFTQFCDERGISERDRMPASSLLLACFAARHAGEVGGTSLDTRFLLSQSFRTYSQSMVFRSRSMARIQRSLLGRKRGNCLKNETGSCKTSPPFLEKRP